MCISSSSVIWLVVAAGAHKQCAMRDAEIHAFLRRFAGEESIREAGCEPVAAADAVFDFQVGIRRPVVERAVVPHDGRPIVDERRLHAAERRADDFDVRDSPSPRG